MIVLVYAIVVLAYWLILTLWLIIGGNQIKYLDQIPTLTGNELPTVDIIVPVRNEAGALRPAITSLLKLDYPGYNVVAVNDRSTDESLQILRAIQEKFPELRIIDIDSLPGGWLGKNHALYKGASASEATYLLFTDGDVVFEKDALSRAMDFVQSGNLDHLTILPELISSSFWLKNVILTFAIMLTAVQRPWLAKRRKSRASIGVGAFNLVKREMYLHAGTHKSIPMKVDDDLKLAALLKKAGAKAGVLYGKNKIAVEWYQDVKAFVNGLMKNMFSGFRYNVLLAMLGVIATSLFFMIPLPLLFLFGDTIERTVAIAILLVQCIMYSRMPGASGDWKQGILTWFGGSVISYVIVLSTFKTLATGGIYWRDTFYPLKELKNN